MRQSLRPFCLMIATLACAACNKSEESADQDAAASPEPKAQAAEDDAKADAVAKADEAAADAETDAKADPEAAEAEAAEAAALPEPGQPGPAYFAVRGKGVFVLDGDGFAQVEKGPDKLVKHMQVGPDGAPYLLGFDGIMRVEAKAVKIVAKTDFRNTGSVDDFVIAKQDEFWTVSHKGVGHFVDGKWTLEDKSALGADVKLLDGIALDGEGRPWVISSNKLHVREGDAWKDVDLSAAGDRKPFFNTIVSGPENQIYAVASSALLRSTGPGTVEAVDLKLSGFTSFDNLRFSQNGIGVLQIEPRVIMQMLPDGNGPKYEAAKDFFGDRIVELDVDDLGRTWVSTDEGLTVFGPGNAKTEWALGSVEQLAGQVEGILVVGAGPAELPQVGAVKKGGVKGQILADGKGLAQAEVEVCPSPDSIFETSPCADARTRFAGQTDAEGRFDFADVPLGAYGVAVKVGDKWQVTFGAEFGADMKEGETLDIGSIKVRSAT